MLPDYFRVLSLDGGGAKGFYTLGVLHEIEALIGCKIHERFDLIFGTSTGAIIASLLALGKTVPEIHDLYCQYVPTIMQKKQRDEKSLALAELAKDVYGAAKFDAVKTNIGIVATKWLLERPMIFKANIQQAHGRQDLSEPVGGYRVLLLAHVWVESLASMDPRGQTFDQFDLQAVCLAAGRIPQRAHGDSSAGFSSRPSFCNARK